MSAMRLHAREGKQPGDLSGAADKESRGRATLAANVSFTLEDDVHSGSGIAFMEERGAGRFKALDTVRSEPFKLALLHAVKGSDALESFDQFRNRRASGCAVAISRIQRRGRAGGGH